MTQRARVAVWVVAWTLALATALAALLAPAPRRVGIRWAPGPGAAWLRWESELQLTGREPAGERTWSYELRDTSASNIRRLIADPRVEDTSGIDRQAFRLTPERPALRERVRATYRRPALKTITTWWPGIVLVLLVVGLAAGWPSLRAWQAADRTRLPLATLILVSALIRGALIFSGGQMYWPDERRYNDSRDLIVALAARNPTAARLALREPAHVLFKMTGMVPAAVEGVRGTDDRIPAVFFGICSVLNIWLLARVAISLDASSEEALLGAGLMAASTSLLYYSGHLLPYDLSMTFGLLAMRAGSRPVTEGRSSLACGLWAGCAFLAYAGYWLFGAATCVIHVCDPKTGRDAIGRAARAAAGVSIVIGAALAAYAVAGLPTLTSLKAFASAVTQGDYTEGWSLPIVYLWHAEHWLLVLWLMALGWSIWCWRVAANTRTLRAGLVGVASIYLVLLLFSTGLHLFVVYGRLARQLVPFLCLITAAMLMRLRLVRPAVAARVLPLVVAGIAGQALFNLAGPLRQEFPAEFLSRAQRLVRTVDAPAIMLTNVEHIYPRPRPVVIPPGYRELAAAAHPLQYLPYQYEGYTPAERDALRATDIRMRILVADRVTAP